MKKFFAILLAMTMIFALVACGNTTTDDTAKDDATKPSEAAPAASADSDVQKDFELEDCKQYAKDVDTKGMTFYWVGKVLGGTYWTGVETGMKAAADELGIEIIMQGVEKETDIDVQLNNLQNALAAGGSVTVANDMDPAATLTTTGKATLDANGKTIANTTDIWEGMPIDWSLVSARGSGANLTITGNGKFEAKTNDCYAVDVQDGATVTIENGTFNGNIHAVYVLEGTAYIKGGFFSVQQKYPDATKADGFVLNCYDANRANGTATIVVTGGTFVNFNPADCWAEGEHTNFVADGYTVTSETQTNGDIWYTVVAA